MEIVPLMLIAVIMILLSSFPAPIKVAGKRGGGGGSIGIGSGYRGGGGGVKTGGSIRDGSNVGTGYRGGASNGKPSGGGDTGPALVVIPKKQEKSPKGIMTMPQECKPEVRDCINDHVLGPAGRPKYRGPCCTKLRHSVRCVCKFLTSPDPNQRSGGNDVLRGCHYTRPKCSKVPMPQVCKPEVTHCINVHIYGGPGAPPHGGACCKKFKLSQSCVCAFIASQDSRLSKNANNVIQGCRFGKPNCTKI